MSFRMNSPQGKAILALVRRGDYAHPGEEEAIQGVVTLLPRQGVSRLLDVGCGRGGTADWFRRHGWGQVVAIDIDQESIRYGQQTYPEIEFHACDVDGMSQLSLPPFDVAYLFNSFYAFSDQQKALGEIRSMCRDGAHVLIFDYTRPHGGDLPVALGSEIGRPVVIETLRSWMSPDKWETASVTDMTGNFVAWYQALVQKIEEKQQPILELAGRDWYDYVLAWYSALRDALVVGALGGAVVHAIVKRKSAE